MYLDVDVNFAQRREKAKADILKPTSFSTHHLARCHLYN